MIPSDMIPKNLVADIRAAIADLDKIRTGKNRDAVVWAQYVLTACAASIDPKARVW